MKATGKGGEKIDSGRIIVDDMSMDTKRLKQSASANIESRIKNPSSTEWAKSSLDLETQTSAKSGSVSGRKLDHGSGSSYSFAEQKGSYGTSHVEGRSENGSAEISDHVASSGKSKYLEYREEELFHFEKSGMWIFPSDQKQLCITTAGKRAMNVLGSRKTEAGYHQKRKTGFLSGHVDKVLKNFLALF